VNIQIFVYFIRVTFDAADCHLRPCVVFCMGNYAFRREGGLKMKFDCLVIDLRWVGANYEDRAKRYTCLFTFDPCCYRRFATRPHETASRSEHPCSKNYTLKMGRRVHRPRAGAFNQFYSPLPFTKISRKIVSSAWPPMSLANSFV
jgi:hypothetical protein